MENESRAELVSYNINNIELCASAARISTTQGNAIQIFEKAKGNDKNQELIKKVLLSGHKSIIEHSIFTIAFRNVSAFVEQFFIECRLASFTVKSRRYVDFSRLGYYIPPDLKGEDLEQYCQYMDMLFSAYQTMLDGGIPKEDARFILPYSFNSNFYCTLNARELSHIILSIRRGRGQGIHELQNLADQIVKQVEEIFPSLLSELENISDENITSEAFSNDCVRVQDTFSLIGPEEAGNVSLLNAPLEPLKILEKAYSVYHPDSDRPFEIEKLLKSERPREMEQLSYSFLISNITLSGITHIVRHRLQSIVVPPIQSIDHSKFIVPATIKNNNPLFEFYRQILEKANNMMKQMSQNQSLRKYSYYYALSGNTMDIMTTVNARELNHFIKLRTCNRAQWEIRKISIEMLRHLRRSFPEFFNCFGTSCYVDGACPEGKLSCNQMKQVVDQFKYMV